MPDPGSPEGRVVIVGGGLAGLACAKALSARDVPCLLLEATDDVGGRVRTDLVDGFRLDRGFQVLLTAYPETRAALDYDALDLKPFEPGALIRYGGRFHRFVDPWRRPRHALAGLFSGAATLGDKLRVAWMRRHLLGLSLVQLERRPEQSTMDRLRERGFSDRIIGTFFRPFLGGVFLERELETSSRKFEFLFRMFSLGDAALPAEGMQAIPRQLAAGLPGGTLRMEALVAEARPDGVTLADGETIGADAVVLAVEPPAAARLLGEEPPPGNAVACIYYAAERPPVPEPILVLNGEGEGPVNNLCVPSQVAPGYAPEGEALVSVTVLGDPETDDGILEEEVREQLVGWFGEDVRGWRTLRALRIPFAVPRQSPPALTPVSKPAAHPSGIFIAGDALDLASIHGAMVSGRRAAEAVLERGP